MPVPVIVIVPAQEPIRESATAFAAGRSPTMDLRSATMPDKLTIDPRVPAVPLGTGRLQDIGMAPMTPQASEAFAVRAVANVDTVEEVPEEIEGRRVFADPVIDHFTCGSTPAIGNAALVAAHLRIAALTANNRGLDGSNVAVAIMDTGINLAHLSGLVTGARLDVANSWTPPSGMILPGKYPVDHGTVCAFDALIAAPKATLLDYPILASASPGGSISGRTIATAMVAFSHVFTGWAVSFAPGGVSKYAGLVINNSWGIYHPSWDFPAGYRGRYIDNPQHPFNLLVGTMAAAGHHLCRWELWSAVRRHSLQDSHGADHHGSQRTPGRADRGRVRHKRSDRRLFLAGSLYCEHVPAEARRRSLHALPWIAGVWCGESGQRHFSGVPRRRGMCSGDPHTGPVCQHAADIAVRSAARHCSASDRPERLATGLRPRHNRPRRRRHIARRLRSSARQSVDDRAVERWATVTRIGGASTRRSAGGPGRRLRSGHHRPEPRFVQRAGRRRTPAGGGLGR
ncbi:MAG TPA: hypothetical protein VGD94_07015 [Vicinamibacterales bacterium]